MPDFAWSELVLLGVIAVPPLWIAVLCVVLFASYLGPQFDVVIINDHVLGGTSDQMTVVTVGTVFGAAGIFSALRFRNSYAARQRGNKRNMRVFDDLD